MYSRIISIKNKFLDYFNFDKNRNIRKYLTSTYKKKNNQFFYYVVGYYNPQLIESANKSKEYLEIKNIDFKVQNFEKDTIKEKFDIILSLANHHTYDKGISSTDLYFEKILRWLLDHRLTFKEIVK